MLPYVFAAAAAYGVYSNTHILAYGGIVALLLFGCGSGANIFQGFQPSIMSGQ